MSYVAARATPEASRTGNREFTEEFAALADVMQTWWDVSILESSHTQTVRNSGVLCAFFDFINVHSLLDVETTAIHKYLIHLYAKGRSPKTIKNHWGSISQFCNFWGQATISKNGCHRTGRITPQPARRNRPLREH